MTDKGKVVQTVVTTETTTDYDDSSFGGSFLSFLPLFNFWVILFLFYHRIPAKTLKKKSCDCDQ